MTEPAIFKKIFHGAEHGAEKIVDTVEFPIKVIRVLGVAMKDDPALAQSMQIMLTLGQPVVTDLLADVAANGLNPIEDIKTVADIVTFFKAASATFAAVEKAYGDLQGHAGQPTTAKPQ